MSSPNALVKARPAEAGGVAGYAALLIARAAGVTDADTILALAGVVAFAPAAITWFVTLIRSR